ncbi:hypothetical protein CLV62_12743 [Dysgonomonas alginatilytica]|uniref:Uncharacterized protein n=1 Tax=Dysgonomonas alginatilytica TaxID=1605892 RepID=A0A2V3PJX0_9BACT|nr:hypothetical protein CLV62_12743 [Dysgonomonas alginatilytica]
MNKKSFYLNKINKININKKEKPTFWSASLSYYPIIYRISVYSHSIVAGGLDDISYTTRFTPFTLLIISLETFARNS